MKVRILTLSFSFLKTVLLIKFSLSQETKSSKIQKSRITSIIIKDLYQLNKQNTFIDMFVLITYSTMYSHVFVNLVSR